MYSVRVFQRGLGKFVLIIETEEDLSGIFWSTIFLLTGQICRINNQMSDHAFLQTIINTLFFSKSNILGIQQVGWPRINVGSQGRDSSMQTLTRMLYGHSMRVAELRTVLRGRTVGVQLTWIKLME